MKAAGPSTEGPMLSWIGRHRVLSAFVGLLLFVWVTGAAAEDDGEATTPTASTSSRGDVERDSSPKVGEASGGGDSRSRGAGGAETRGDGKTRGEGRTRRPKATRTTRPKPNPPELIYVVARIVDGDTVELGNGEIVRLAGMDTPEIGECGFESAAANLSRLVLGKQVRLGATDEDRDGYGRLLRYVDVGDMDAGLRLIKNGLAIARYDSRDGYGYHPREPRYIAADRGARNLSCPKPKPVPLAGGGSCAPGYQPCVAAYPPDLDCADVDGPVVVTGTDPHGLDGDGDGVACE